MNNISLNTSFGSNSLARTGHRTTGLGLSRASVVVQTAAILATQAPRRAAPGGPSKRRKATAMTATPFQTTPARHPAPRKTRKSGTRVRESDHSEQRATQENTASRTSQSAPPAHKALKKGQKNRKMQQPRPAGGRTGSTASADGRRRQRRSEALDDFPLARGRSSGVASPSATDEQSIGTPGPRQKRGTFCNGNSYALGQRNFTRIHENLGGCYRLVEDVVIKDSQALPVGRHGHPFVGRLDTDGHTLSVQLMRPQGDAVLFGSIDNSKISLTLTDCRLETRNGSLAAVIGAMGSDNHVSISRLQNCVFNATGEGRVEAGLVGTTSGANNRIDLYDATGNEVLAHALAPSGPCSGSCQPAAAVSLGLGALRIAVPARPFPNHVDQQFILQRRISDNRLQALADAGPTDRRQLTDIASAQASAGLLGLLGQSAGHQDEYRWTTITSRQDRLYNNQILAHAAGRQAMPQTPGSTGYSCASLGYGTLECDPSVPVRPTDWLYVSQVACRNNSVQAQASGADGHNARQGAIARATMAATHTVRFLQAQHRDLTPGQVTARAEGGLAQRALLAPSMETWLQLYTGGDPDLPLLARWDGAGFCSNAGVVDTAAYTLNETGLNCVPAASLQQAQWARTRTRIEALKFSSLDPGSWRWLHDSMRYSEFHVFGFDNPACYDHDSALHYPHEALQSLVSSDSQWLLVSRQHYPGKPEHDAQGLLRVTRYRIPHAPLDKPETEARAQDRGVLLYQAHRRNPVLQAGAAVYSLVQGHQLHQLYQKPGQPSQILSLPLDVFNAQYQLADYDMEGQARLLSLEDGELNLWMQHNNSDTLFVYGLGSAPAVTNSSSRLRWGFDLSDQPGGLALLARDGDWLYSVRQQDGQPASLRRLNVSTGLMDAGWQQDWPGTVTDDLRLTTSLGQLTALPAGTLVNPRTPTSGFQAQIPDTGGCLQWSQPTLVRHILPRTAAPSAVPGDAVTHSPTSPVPGGTVTHSPALQSFSVAVTAGSVAGSAALVAAVSLMSSCIGFLVWKKGRRQWTPAGEEQRSLAPEAGARFPLPFPASASSPQQPALVCEKAVEAGGPFRETAL